MKNYSQEVIDALRNDNATCNLIEMRLAGGTVFFTDAGRDITWQGQTYTASGLVTSLDSRQKQSQFQVQSFGVQFSTADQAVIALFGNDNQKGRTAIIREVIFDDDRNQVVGELQVQRYIINAPSQRDGSFTVDMSNYAARWRTVRGMRTTQASHRIFYPDSTSFINSKDVKSELEWGGE